MNSSERRKEILQLLSSATRPISGDILAEKMDVSRQIIVGDIATLRADGQPIMSTNRGYVYGGPAEHQGVYRRAVEVCHDDSQMEAELNTIVDYGGTVLNVVIDHDVYGQLTADLVLRNRLDVADFMDRIRHSKSAPLKNLTDGRHIHMVEANSEALLDIIEEQLRLQGFLAI